MDKYVHFIYRITRDFPKEKLHGITAQIKIAAFSIILNILKVLSEKKYAKISSNFV